MKANAHILAGLCSLGERHMHRLRALSRGGRLLFAFAVVAAVGLAVGGISLATQAPANDSNPIVLNVVSRATSISNFVNTGPAGLSPGDLYVFSDRLFLTNASNDQVGTDDGRCVLIDPATLKFDCSVTNTIPEGEPLDAGQIMAAGELTLVPGTTSTFAVVGGTGAYRNARGDASVDLGPPEGPHELTANLILNP